MDIYYNICPQIYNDGDKMIDLVFCDFEGQVITPDNKNYDKLRQEWNRSIQKYPIAIVYCNNACDVSESIIYARENCIPIRIRSGGHNYEGYSTGNKVLVIDISRINYIRINYDNNTINVGGGIKNTQIYNLISQYDYPFPGGTCPTVGVSGYVTGGGWGYLSRKYGLGCDSLVEAEIVDYRGCILKLNDSCNSDLFWAIRGAGGGNFGVITSLTFTLPQKVDKVTYFQIYCPNIKRDAQIQFLDIFQKWIKNIDNSINLSGGLYNSLVDGKYAFLRGISFNTVDVTKTLLSVFSNLPNVEMTYQYDRFINVINEIGSSYPQYEKFKSTGRFVNKLYNIDELSKFVDIINQDRPEGSILTQISLYGLGGKVSEVKKTSTAFYYRDAMYILGIQSVWENNDYKDKNVEWVLKNFKYIYENTIGSYINFPIMELPNYEQEYYGMNIYRLKIVKQKYDPYDVFRFYQSIKA